MEKLTPKEKAELIYFVKRVMSWEAVSGPYGDGDDITDKKGYATMQRVLAKLEKWSER